MVPTLPKVGLSPDKPQNEAGNLMDPPVSVPKAQGAMPEATATADPLLDPPGVLGAPSDHGFEGVPMCSFNPQPV